MRVTGKSVPNDPDILDINLADDFNDVTGFGQPITAGFAKRLVRQYVEEYISAYEVIKLIDANATGTYNAIKAMPEYDALKRLMDPSNHIISGVFGKETLLQLLAQKTAEGVRYIFGQYRIPAQGMEPAKYKTTLVLVGVKETKAGTVGGSPAESEGLHPDMKAVVEATSVHKPDDKMLVEVHGSSKTVAEIAEMIGMPKDGMHESTKEEKMAFLHKLFSNY